MMDRRRSWADPRPGVRGAICFTAHPRCAPVRRTQEQRQQEQERREIVLQITERAMIGRPAAFQLVVKEWSVRKNVRRSRHAIRARSRRPDRNTWKGVRNRRPAEISRGPIGPAGGHLPAEGGSTILRGLTPFQTKKKNFFYLSDENTLVRGESEMLFIPLVDDDEC